MILSRQCPTCSKLLFYASKGSLNRAVNKKSECANCAGTGSNNHFFGKHHTIESKLKSIFSKRNQDIPENISKEEMENILSPILESKCPECSVIIHYASKGCLISARKHNALCLSCAKSGSSNSFFGKLHSEETKANIRLKRIGNRNSPTTEFKKGECSGASNPMYGKSVYSVWLTKYGKDEADRRMNSLKQKRSRNASGENNPMYGKPSPQGSGNGWKGWYRNWFFRSLRELTYAVALDKAGIKWKSAEIKSIVSTIQIY